MPNWLLINLSAVDTATATAQTAKVNHVGACHDGINTVFTWISPEAEAIADKLLLFAELEPNEALAYIGHHLSVKPDIPLMAPRSLLSSLFRTPEWRLWCGQYETWQDLEADHQTVFGEGVDGRTALPTLVAQAKEKLFALMTGAV